MAWDQTVPVSGTAIISIPAIHYGNWTAFEDTFAREHYSFSETVTANEVEVAMSGRHIAGMTSILTAGTSAMIAAISPTSVADGWLALDNDQSTLYYGARGSWKSLSASGVFKRSIAMVGLSTTQVIASTTETTIPFDSEVNDPGSCFSTTTHKFTPASSGVYLVTLNSALSGYGGQEYEVALKYSYYIGTTLYSGAIASFRNRFINQELESQEYSTIWECPADGVAATSNVPSGGNIWATIKLINYDVSTNWQSIKVFDSAAFPATFIVVRLV